MASVIKINRKTRAGLTPHGKPIWKRAPGVRYCAKICTVDGEWIQLATHQVSKHEALKWAAERCACTRCGGPERIRARQAAEAAKVQAAVDAKTCGELIDEWSKTLVNRSAVNDRSRIKRHVRPAFADKRIADLTLPAVMKWIDQLRAGRAQSAPGARRGRGAPRAEVDGRLSDATVRAALNLLSRFLSWCVTRGHAQVNVVRLIPTGERPQQTAKSEAKPWIADDKVVRDLMGALAPPFREMFYLGNRSGLRPGEQRGLRMSDLGYLADGIVRVRYSDLGCLKEDKRQVGKVKWAPAPDDIQAVMAPWLARRAAEGAQPEDHAFMPGLSRSAVKQRMSEAWAEATDALGLSIGFYEATRHSMVSRSLSAGVPLDEVSSAIGHTTPLTTQRHYAHFIRKTFSPAIRAGIGAKEAPTEGTTTPIRKTG